jgi:2'-5' RNA ligase
MRLFIAVDPDAALGRAIGTLMDRAQAALMKRGSVQASWAAADRVHLTLHFLGETDESRVPALVDAVARPIDVPPFDLEFGGLGVFPSHGRPRVLWLGVRRGQEALGRVQQEIGRRLTALKFPIDARPFAPHVTLARFREPSPAPSEVRSLITREAASLGASRIDAVTLYRSQLGRQGSTYTDLATGRLLA